MWTARWVAVATTDVTVEVAMPEPCIDELASEGSTNGRDLVYSITGGPDQALFQIDMSTGVLTFITAPDFETPLDVGADNVYNLTLRVTDNHGLFLEQNMVVTVTPHNDNIPAITSPDAVNHPENVLPVQDLTSSDADRVLTVPIATDGTVSLVDNDLLADGESFYMQVTLTGTDTSATGLHGLVALGPNGTGQEIFLGDALGTSDWLVGQDIAGFESRDTGSAVSGAATTLVLKATNAVDGQDTFTWWINPNLAGDEASSTPTGTGTLTIGEVKDIFGFQILTDETSTPTASDAFVHLSGASPFVTPIPTEQTRTFTITGAGADNGQFEIVDDELRFITAPDFEVPTDANTDNVYEVSIQVDDNNGFTSDQTILVTVGPVNDIAPVFTSPDTAGVNENEVDVLTLTATDGDLPAQTVVFSIAGAGADNALFELVGDDLKFITAPDFENPVDQGGTPGDNIYEVTVLADDQNGLTTPQTILVEINPVNDLAPVFTSTDMPTVAENVLLVQPLTATDGDLPTQTVTFSIAGAGADNAKFEMVGDELRFLVAPDFENPNDSGGTANDNVYEVTVLADDGQGMTTPQTILVEVTAVNDLAPVFTSATTAMMNENTQSVQTLTATDADLPAQTVTFAIATGSIGDSALFEVVGNELRFIVAPDFENANDMAGVAAGDNIYEVTVEANDGQGLTTTQVVEVTVLDVDDTNPILLSFERQDPMSQFTAADVLTFRVTFDEPVLSVDITDFELGSDTTATITAVAPVSGTGETVFDITVSGGDLATFNGLVAMNLSATHNITDVAMNTLPNLEPATDQRYTVDNIAPQVAVVVGEGLVSRSAVRSLTINFDSDVVYDAGAIVLETSGGTPVPFTASIAPGVTTSQVVLTFPGNTGDSLADGNYRVRIASTGVRDLAQNALDGNASGMAGGDSVDDFFRLYGDVDGDRDVDVADYGQFAGTLFKSSADAGFNSELDFDNDGDVDGQDFARFRAKLNSRLEA